MDLDMEKGNNDGDGTMVKRALCSKQLLNPYRTLHNAQDCVTFLNAALVGKIPSIGKSMR